LRCLFGYTSQAPNPSLEEGGGTARDIIRRVHTIKRCGAVSSRHRALKGVTCVVFSGSTRQAPNLSLGAGAGRDTSAGIAHSAFLLTPGHMQNNGQAIVPLDAACPTPLNIAATSSTSSQVIGPFYGPTKVEPSSGGAFYALLPISGHVQNDGRNSAQFSSVPAFQPTPRHAATASMTNQVVDPFYGPTKVVATTGGAFRALQQPESGHVQDDGRASSVVPPVMVPMPPVIVPMPPLFAVAAVRFHG
jgi:hypothetical protein